MTGNQQDRPPFPPFTRGENDVWNRFHVQSISWCLCSPHRRRSIAPQVDGIRHVV